MNFTKLLLALALGIPLHAMNNELTSPQPAPANTNDLLTLETEYTAPAIEVSTGPWYNTRPQAYQPAIGEIGFSQSGLKLAVLLNDQQVQFVDLRTTPPTAVAEETVHGDHYLGEIVGCKISDDGRICVIGKKNGSFTIKYMNPNTSSIFAAHNYLMNSFTLMPNKDEVVAELSSSGGRYRHATKIIHLGVHHTLESTNVQHKVKAISPDGTKIIVEGHWGSRYHDTLTRKLEEDTPLPRMPKCEKMLFSPNGQLVAAVNERVHMLDQKTDTVCCHGNNALSIYDGSRFEKLSSLEGHKLPIYALAFARSSRILASGSNDKNVFLWNVSDPRNPQHITSINLGTAVTALRFSPKGTRLATGDFKGNAKVWRLQKELLALATTDAATPPHATN